MERFAAFAGLLRISWNGRIRRIGSIAKERKDWKDWQDLQEFAGLEGLAELFSGVASCLLLRFWRGLGGSIGWRVVSMFVEGSQVST